MPTLTYNAVLGPDDLTVGDPLGYDSTRWPYQVTAVANDGRRTWVTLEPWPIPVTEQEKDAYRRITRG